MRASERVHTTILPTTRLWLWCLCIHRTLNYCRRERLTKTVAPQVYLDGVYLAVTSSNESHSWKKLIERRVSVLAKTAYMPCGSTLDGVPFFSEPIAFSRSLPSRGSMHLTTAERARDIILSTSKLRRPRGPWHSIANCLLIMMRTWYEGRRKEGPPKKYIKNSTPTVILTSCNLCPDSIAFRMNTLAWSIYPLTRQE